MTNQWGQGERGILPPRDTAPFYTTTSDAQWRLEGKNAAQQKAVFQTKELQITKRGMGGNQMSHSVILDRLCISGKIGYTLTNVDSKCILQRGKKRASTTIIPSTHEGRARVVPATCPGKQEHLTVWERSSILFLLQQRWAATTSQVPVRSGFDPERERQRSWNGGNICFACKLRHLEQLCSPTVTLTKWWSVVVTLIQTVKQAGNGSSH